LVSGVLVLGGASIFERTIKAQTILTESVNGLDVGAAVKYRGVTIGKVSEIEVAGAKYGPDVEKGSSDTGSGAIVVEMLIQSKGFPGRTNAQIETLLHRLADEGLRVRVTTAGLSGQAFLELNFMDPKAYPPPQIGFNPTELYIPSAPSAMNQALEAVEHIAVDLQKANLPQLVTHYDQLATRATAAIDGVNDLVQGNRPALNTAMADLPDITRRMRSITDRADTFLKDPRLGKMLAALPATADNANAAVSDLRSLLQDTQGLLAEEKDDLRSVLADLRRAAADAAMITDEAKQNPARVLFGQPPAHLKEGQ
jgi:phospholipid/cholesterol/gamma-HCH transport system substrate-binding protein